MRPNQLLNSGQNAPSSSCNAARALVRLAAVFGLMFSLSACAIPPVISLASLAADGVLLAATGKSKADHGISLVTGRDCETFRALSGENVCRDEVTAELEPLPADIERDLAVLRAETPVFAAAADSGAALAMAALESKTPAAGQSPAASGLTLIARAETSPKAAVIRVASASPVAAEPAKAAPGKAVVVKNADAERLAVKANAHKRVASATVVKRDAGAHAKKNVVKTAKNSAKTGAKKTAKPMFLAWMAR